VGRVLGEAPEAICVGETRYLWSRGLLSNVMCGCGVRFHSCSFWRAVGEEAFGGWAAVDAEAVAALDTLTVRLRTAPRHLQPRLSPRFSAAVAEYRSILQRLYAAIGTVSGARTIIDTSKEPSFALLLSGVARADLRIVHLVRDSRAVAYSWTRQELMPSPIGGQTTMPRFRPAETATRWLLWNAAYRALGARHSRYLRVTYESFIADPRARLRELSAFAGTSLVQPALTGASVSLGAHHMFSGNPMRARTGQLELRLDDEWTRQLPRSQFATVTAITFPELRAYGYPLLPAARRGTVGS
jgi:hypothetical protein